MESFMRWAGSKRSILGKLSEMCPNKYNRYFEPFCGSACLFFNLGPANAVLSDLNEELVCTYRQIRTNVDLVIEGLERLKFSKTNYYSIRSVDISTLTDVERASRFLFLNHYCFNGIYRTNKLGNFNVPVALDRANTPIPYDRLKRASRKLANTRVICSDFENSISAVRVGDFVYMDPPYALQNRRVFSEYHKNSFSFKDLERFSAKLDELEKIGAKFLVSYAYSSEVIKFFKKWNLKKIKIRRHVSGFASSRRFAYEYCISNY